MGRGRSEGEEEREEGEREVVKIQISTGFKHQVSMLELYQLHSTFYMYMTYCTCKHTGPVNEAVGNTASCGQPIIVHIFSPTFSKWWMANHISPCAL